VQIGQIDLLARLFENIMLPSIVADELRHPSAPAEVQAWTSDCRLGGSVACSGSRRPWTEMLDPGERSAIALGLALKADLILIDERKGAVAARTRGFEVPERSCP